MPAFMRLDDAEAVGAAPVELVGRVAGATQADLHLAVRARKATGAKQDRYSFAPP